MAEKYVRVAQDALEPHMSKVLSHLEVVSHHAYIKVAHQFSIPMQSTFEVHWGKHHRTYVNNLNNQIQGKDLESKSLEEVPSHLICAGSLRVLSWRSRRHTVNAVGFSGPDLCLQVVQATWNNGSPSAEFNNAAQAWNHKFFWSCMKAGGGGESCKDATLCASIMQPKTTLILQPVTGLPCNCFTGLACQQTCC